MERIYLANRTVGGIVNVFKDLQGFLVRIKNFRLADAYQLEHYLASINSYFGFMARKNTYGIKRKIIKECPLFFKFFYMKGRFESVRLKKEFCVKYQLIKMENYG